jgi:hypothetical protein
MVAITSHRHVKWRLFLWAHRELWYWAPKQSPLQALNIRDMCCEPVSPPSQRNETRLFQARVSRLKETCVVNPSILYLDERAKVWGPPVSIGNRILCYSLHCWHVCNERSK